MAANRSNGNTKKKTTASSGKKTVRSAKTRGGGGYQLPAVRSGGSRTFAVCAFLFLSNFHICGMVGDVLSQVMLGVFGSIGYIAPLFCLRECCFMRPTAEISGRCIRCLAVEILLIVLCGLAQLTFGGGYQEGPDAFRCL